MSIKLVTVLHNDATNGRVLSLDDAATLDKIRSTLISRQLMTNNDAFILGGNPLDREDETITPLSLLLGETAVLRIGATNIGPENSNRPIASWNSLSPDQRNVLLKKIEINRGLILGESTGFSKSFNDLVSWDASQIRTTNPRIISEVSSDMSFSKMTNSLTTSSMHKASLSFTSPWVSAESEFSHEKSKTTSSEEIKTYLVAKYISRKVAIDMPVAGMQLSDEFIAAVRNAVSQNSDKVDGYSKLIEVLNNYGYYVASSFTLGGVLFSSKETKTKTFSQAETEKQSFSVGFSAAFKGIGGSAAYSNASGSESSSSTTTTTEVQTLQQIGGISGTNNDYDKWVLGLDAASNWDVASYEKLIPVIGLLGMKNQGLGNTCVNLLTKFFTYASVKDRQTVLDMGAYARRSQEFFSNPF
jgi:hypothetical protein